MSFRSTVLSCEHTHTHTLDRLQHLDHKVIGKNCRPSARVPAARKETETSHRNAAKSTETDYTMYIVSVISLVACHYCYIYYDFVCVCSILWQINSLSLSLSLSLSATSPIMTNAQQ